MLKKEENPGLYDAIYRLYGTSGKIIKDERGYRTIERYFEEGEPIPDNVLGNVGYLPIHSGSDLKTLDGLEKLQNLKTLEIFGCTDRDFSYTEVAQTEEAKQLLQKERAEAYNRGQIEDFSALYKCKNIKSLTISGQRNLIDFYAENLPKLRELNINKCSNLDMVSGLHKLDIIKEIEREPNLTSVCKLRIVACDMLTRVEGLSTFGELAKNKVCFDPKEKTSKPLLELPLNTYLYMKNGKSKGLNNYENALADKQVNEPISWVDNGCESCESSYSTKQMQMIKGELDKISREVWEYGGNVNKNILNTYSWITSNLKYDYDAVREEEKLDDFKMGRSKKPNSKILENLRGTSFGESQMFKRLERSYEKAVRGIYDSEFMRERNRKWQNTVEEQSRTCRSNYTALFDKKVVCVGFSNIFNLLLVNNGVSAGPCFCASVNSRDGAGVCRTNHQISVIRLAQVEGPGRVVREIRFCDPTWDVGKQEFKYFNLTRAEIEKTHWIPGFYEAGVRVPVPEVSAQQDLGENKAQEIEGQEVASEAGQMDMSR